MEQTSVILRFYEELNYFLKDHSLQKTDIPFTYPGKRSVKDLIESFNIPHVEVDLIMVNGESKGFEYIPENGDRISAYPVFERFNISELKRTGDPPLRTPRFVLDVHLGKLAKLLRLLGFDVDYQKYRDDPELAKISAEENRILLTRDRGLVKRRIVTRGMIIRSQDPMKQAEQVLDRLDIRNLANPFTLCPICGGELIPVPGEGPEFEKCRMEVPQKTASWCRDFSRCNRCGKIYWQGDHWEKLKTRVNMLLQI